MITRIQSSALSLLFGSLLCTHLVSGPALAGSADLRVSIDAPSTIAAGESLTYIATLTNHGPVAAENAQWLVFPPWEIEVQSITASDDGVCIEAAEITCRWPRAISVDADRSVVVSSLVPPETYLGPLSIQFLSFSRADNARTYPGFQTTSVFSVADLAIEMRSSPDPFQLGALLRYEVTLRNAGPSLASGATVDFDVPSAAVLVSVAPSGEAECVEAQTVRCTWPPFAPGSTSQLTIEVRAPQDASSVLVARATALLRGWSGDPNSENDSVRVVSGTEVNAVPAVGIFGTLALTGFLLVAGGVAFRRAGREMSS